MFPLLLGRLGWAVPAESEPPPGGYTPPPGNDADLIFDGSYTPPAGNAANLTFED